MKRQVDLPNYKCVSTLVSLESLYEKENPGSRSIQGKHTVAHTQTQFLLSSRLYCRFWILTKSCHMAHGLAFLKVSPSVGNSISQRISRKNSHPALKNAIYLWLYSTPVSSICQQADLSYLAKLFIRCRGITLQYNGFIRPNMHGLFYYAIAIISYYFCQSSRFGKCFRQ